MDKQPMKVALLNAQDYHRNFFTAYPTLIVEDHDKDGDFRWKGRIESYKPIAWTHNGETRSEAVAEVVPGDDREWAAFFPDAPRFHLPPPVPVLQAQYLTMNAAEQAVVRAQQDMWRAQVALQHSKNPQPVYVLAETEWSDNLTKDDADEASQLWAIDALAAYEKRSNPNKQSGHALVINPFGAGPGAMILDLATRALGRDKVVKAIRKSRTWREFVSWALGYATAVRTNMLTQLENAMDAGAGAAITRGYDGTRPATGGTATTLLWDATMADPAGSVASAVLTFSSMPRTDTSANAAGTLTWGREVDSTAAFVFDFNCGTSGSDMNFNTVTISVGLQVSIDSWTITEGNA